MNAGWQWRIPTQDRWGCGYVYDSNHKTEDQALKELELDIGQPVEPIKIIKFDRAIGLKKSPLLFGNPGPRPSSPAVA